MRKRTQIPLLAAFACLAAFTGSMLVPDTGNSADMGAPHDSAISVPALEMKDWKIAAQEEKLAFLLGFVTMLDLEKEWQGNRPVPISRSINNSWVKGLQGKALGDLCKALDTYVEQNPDKLDVNVVTVLGRLYVRPALTPQARKEAGEHYRKMMSQK